ncbi:hypothetical protein B6U70_03185 [Euryarchaeota archaeon ex4484_162]|nr:MAG: hypothetical protein B6U70_03185 [Euryarchaeota archaeon ex4484_162]
MTSNDNKEISSHIEDITKALGDKIGKEVTVDELEKQLQKFLEYGVPIQQAKKTIIRKYGSDTSAGIKRKLLKELKPSESNVNIIGRVITQLNFGEYTKVEPSKEEIPETQEIKRCKVDELKSGLGSVEIVAKILSVKEKEVDVGGKKKKVYFGIIADETGKAQFTSWHDFNLKEGEVARITGGYVKSWRGIPQLTFDEKCKVEKMSSKEIKEVNIKKYRLWELVEKGGALDVEVEGNVIEIRDGSGVIVRCPQCNRVLFDGKCKIHGSVKGIYDLRAKIVLDDGTGAVNVIINRALTEKILDKNLDELKKLYDESEDKVNDLIRDTLLAKKIKVVGNALRNGFGTTILARKIDKVEIDIKEETKRLLQEVREVSTSYET